MTKITIEKTCINHESRVIDREKAVFLFKVDNVQIWLFCHVDNHKAVCYSLAVSRFFYFKFSIPVLLVSMTSEIPALLPNDYNRISGRRHSEMLMDDNGIEALRSVL